MWQLLQKKVIEAAAEKKDAEARCRAAEERRVEAEGQVRPVPSRPVPPCLSPAAPWVAPWVAALSVFSFLSRHPPVATLAPPISDACCRWTG